MTDIKKYRWMIISIILYYAIFYGSGRLISEWSSFSYGIFAVICIASALIYRFLYDGKAINSIVSEDKYRILRIVLGVFIVLGLVVQSASVTAYSTVSICRVFMKDSPVEYILIFVMIPAVFGTYFGLKSMSRYSFVTGHIIIAALLLILVLAGSEYDIGNLRPVFGNGVPSVSGAFFGICIFSSILYLFLISGNGKCRYTDVKNEAVKIILISGAAIVLVCFGYSLSVPGEAVGRFDNPMLAIASEIGFNIFVERCEAAVFLIWIFITFIASGSLLCLSVDVFSKTLALSDRRGIIAVFSAIVACVVISCAKKDSIEAVMAFSLYLTGILSLVIPIVCSVICRTGGKKNEKS